MARRQAIGKVFYSGAATLSKRFDPLTKTWSDGAITKYLCSRVGLKPDHQCRFNRDPCTTISPQRQLNSLIVCCPGQCSDNVNLGGVVIAGRSIVGTYGVNSDCTGSTAMTIGGVDQSWHFLILEDANQRQAEVHCWFSSAASPMPCTIWSSEGLRTGISRRGTAHHLNWLRG